ncbi:minor capsid protein [Dactylosporangium salmoneum]|uniref:Tail terminator n=1 Tax=Dactylosporangium salmoneum TaxID=53361 RepID=A0ABP5SCA7_9ACTN
MSGWTTNLLSGIAQLLADAGVGVWRPDGSPYAAGDTGIVDSGMPPEPERVICLGAYPVSDHPSQADVTVGVQVRTRAGRDPREVRDLDDAVFEVLHGLEQTELGGVRVVQIYRRSSAALGQARDATDRWEWTSNYYVDAMRPTAARPF